MSHTPHTSPNAFPPPPAPEPLRVEWVSDGHENLDLVAWLSARHNLKAPVNKAKASALIAFNLVVSLIALLSILAGLIAGKPSLWGLGLVVLVLCVFALLNLVRLLSPAMFQARVAKMTRKSDAIESTEGRWSCEIASARITFEWLDKGHVSSFPSREITEVAIAIGRVILMAGKHPRGSFPLSALPPGDPETIVWAALRHPVQS